MLNLRRNALLLALAGSLMLTACGDDAATPAVEAGKTAAPAAKVAQVESMSAVDTVKEMNRLMKQNEIYGLVKLMMTPAQLDEINKEWESSRKEPITEDDRKKFAEALAQITAPGAIDGIMAMAEPQLAQYKPQLPMYIGMGVMGLNGMVDENVDMKPEQKTMAKQAINALSAWANKTDLADPARLRKFLTEMANAVKATNVTTLDQVKAMSMQELMGKAGMLMGGMKRGVAAYDLNLDEMMNSVQVEQLSGDATTAKVRTKQMFLGQEIVSDSEMVKIDGRWYAKDAADAFGKAKEAMSGGKLGG